MFEYRVVKRSAFHGFGCYIVCGVYTNEEGEINLVDTGPPEEMSMGELKETLHLYIDALSKPVLNEEDLQCTLD